MSLHRPLACLSLLMIYACVAFSQTVIYVDSAATGENNGTSWNAAFTNLQTALADADTDDSIFVAKGTYYPHITDPLVSFALVDSVVMLGGFAPSFGVTEVEERDWILYPTILSGEIGNPSLITDNTKSVIKNFNGFLERQCVLDGFVISGGYAISTLRGGGWYMTFSSPTIRNCTFKNNYATFGGGIYSGSSAPLIRDCSFVDNDASASYGGAIFAAGSLKPEIRNCTFFSNTSTDGGAINATAPLIVDSCLFEQNTAPPTSGGSAGRGGAMILGNTALTVITHCTFIENNAMQGGAIHVTGTGSTMIDQCEFIANLAGLGSVSNRYGGALYTGSNVWITRCRIIGGTSRYGAGIYSSGGFSGEVRLINTLIAGNYAFLNGGGCYLTGGNPIVTNCTVSGNYSDGYGGGIYITGSAPSVTNTIVYNNLDEDSNGTLNDNAYIDPFGFASNPSYTYSFVHGGFPSGTGNINGTVSAYYPTFIEGLGPLIAPTDSGDYHQTICSYLVDKGLIIDSITVDLDGLERPHPMTSLADLGCYETYRQATEMVTTLVDDVDGSLRQVIADACPNDTVRFTAEIAGDTVLLDGAEIVLDKNLVIEGDLLQNQVISGGSAVRVFRVAEAATVRLRYLFLIEGHANDGVLLNEGILYVKDVRLE